MLDAGFRINADDGNYEKMWHKNGSGFSHH
jgi:hypothetical protein